MTIKGRFDGLMLSEFFAQQHPHIGLPVWQQRAAEGRLELEGTRVVRLDRRIRAGNVLVHIIADEVEPDVSTEVRFIYEDDRLLVLHKPAPLPVHPCGRFRRNSLVPLLQHAFGECFRPVHRLDADTTGLMVLAKTQPAAACLSKQFEARQVSKIYLVLIQGRPACNEFACDLPLTSSPAGAGKRQTTTQPELERTLQPARTAFRVLAQYGMQTLITAAPSSGRTNQIRVHLAALGHPIVGDASYATHEEFTSGRSLLCLHAWKLGFLHPEGHPVQFEDTVPSWARLA